MSLAAIAIGSNSTRMLVRLDDGREFRERAYTHLFLGLDERQMLTETAMADTAQAICALKTYAQAVGAEQILLYATSAVRDAGNADAFARRLFTQTGLRLTIITGEMEARLAFEAASGGRHCAVLDIGGGSTELTYGQHSVAQCAVSAQEGAVRLSRERAIGDEAAARETIACLRDRLRRAYRALLERPTPPELVGIGGTCTTSAAVLRCTPSHGEELEGEWVPREFLIQLLRRILPLSLEQRAAIPGMYASRAAIMPHGLCILLAVMDLTGHSGFRMSTRNNLDAIVARKGII